MSGWRWLAIVLLLCAAGAHAEQRVTVCFNYGCLTQSEVVYADGQLRELDELFAPVENAADERAARHYLTTALPRIELPAFIQQDELPGIG